MCTNVKICKADQKDLEEILQLQYLSYQSEAALFGNKDIPPLKQTLNEVITEYNTGVILKMVNESNDIIGSIRATERNGTVFIGKLMVHPDHRCNGYGTSLLTEVEKYFPNKRYELFTSTRSIDNLRLYQGTGYREFARKAVNDELQFVYLEKTTKEDFGSLNLRSDEVKYAYKGKTYRLSSHPYEPCLYLWKGDKLACTLHNAYNPEQLVEAFTAGKTVKTNFGKDYDKEYDETGFCRVLAAALDSGRADMDFFYAAKLAKEGSH